MLPTVILGIITHRIKWNPIMKIIGFLLCDQFGCKRKIRILTMVDRVIQQGSAQVLSPIFEKQISDNGSGFRPKKRDYKIVVEVTALGRFRSIKVKDNSVN